MSDLVGPVIKTWTSRFKDERFPFDQYFNIDKSRYFSANLVDNENSEVTKAKYFIRDEFLVSKFDCFVNLTQIFGNYCY